MTENTAKLVSVWESEQRRRWKAGERVLLETFLAENPDVQVQDSEMLDLIYAEFRMRESLGDSPEANEYQRRFPSYRQQLKDLFEIHRAVETATVRDDKRTVMTADNQSASKADDNLPATAHTIGLHATPQAVESRHFTKIGRYLVKHKLGSGGFGVVYQAFDPDLKRDVAIKIPYEHFVSSTTEANSYLAEAQNVARLDHPGIVPVYDVGRTPDGQCYVVSKLISGGSLDRVIEQRRFSCNEAALLVAEVAEALHHAHQRGLVHRDIKPGNILLDAKGHPLVADLGMAISDEQFGKGPGFVGTPAYMSPEQARKEGNLVDARSDIYSLGVVFFELLTGKRPYRSRTISELLSEIASVEPRPPRQLDDSVPDEFDRICLKALAKRPADRYSTAMDFAKALRSAASQTRDEVKPLNAPAWTRWAAMAGLAGLFASLVWLASPGSASSDNALDRVSAAQSGSPNDTRSGAANSLAGNLPDIDIGRENEIGEFAPLDSPLVTGDRVKLHIRTARKQYLYAYWFDADGNSKRLWPKDFRAQEAVDSITYPQVEDEGQEIVGKPGNELLVVGCSPKPLSEQDLRGFEQQQALVSETPTVARLILVPAKQQPSGQRGLGAAVPLTRSPLSANFRNSLQSKFSSYRAAIIPHQ